VPQPAVDHEDHQHEYDERRGQAEETAGVELAQVNAAAVPFLQQDGRDQEAAQGEEHIYAQKPSAEQMIVVDQHHEYGDGADAVEGGQVSQREPPLRRVAWHFERCGGGHRELWHHNPRPTLASCWHLPPAALKFEA